MLFDDLGADVVLDRLGNGLLILEVSKLATNRIGDAGFHDQVEQADIVERRNLARLARLNVRVDEVPHVGFIGF